MFFNEKNWKEKSKIMLLQESVCKFIITSGKMVSMVLTADTISREPSTGRIKHYSLYLQKKKKTNYGRARVNKVDEDFFRSSPGKQ